MCGKICLWVWVGGYGCGFGGYGNVREWIDMGMGVRIRLWEWMCDWICLWVCGRVCVCGERVLGVDVKMCGYVCVFPCPTDAHSLAL